jgi:hypothetical protein
MLPLEEPIINKQITHLVRGVKYPRRQQRFLNCAVEFAW